MSLADPLNPVHRGDELVAEQQFASTLEAELTAARSERDALAAQRDQLISSLNLEKGAATLLLAERDRLASQCDDLNANLATSGLECAALRARLATLRTLLADTRSAIVARAATDPLGLDDSLLPRIDEALA